ncbi:Clp protease N-terminal domain-containing protein [Streptomyces tropicalis]|uniref:Clp protease N-terminal domain-containing protein n=1 Tax=Streptomyces tropicalis TaxID=3034234 RepID=A0ABT5ZZW2_9ACTN|nr:Clp protease N-terminal domain-containing protein [Streptomyces tropicalis]MDF3297929.1 Clp protease N-terminal domain-containing protein [Streptomyces tropicalis]
MFERFTRDARAVVRGAVEHAERTGARSVDAGHLLLALLDRDAGRAASALAALGLDGRREEVRRALDETRRHAGLSRADTDALAGLGIDVPDLVARVERDHGVGALSGDRGGEGGRGAGRRGLDRDAKDTLEKALRLAVARRDGHIGDEHILLALSIRPGVPGEVLADHGVTHASLMRVLHGDGQAQAG